MRLLRLYEFLDLTAMKDLKKSKQKHSKRVAELTKQLTDSEDVYNGAYYHDYLERVGNDRVLTDILSFRSFALVTALTHDDNIDTLEALRKNMKVLRKDFQEDVIIIKLCDRTDNLLKRLKRGELKKKYIHKSADLINYLYKTSDNKENLKEFIENNILSEIPRMIKYIKF